MNAQISIGAKALAGLAAAFGCWFIFLFLFVMLSSLTHPFQLEWIEGQSMDIVRRARLGLPIYAEPSLDYVSLLYTPLFYYAAAAVSFVTGMDFFAGRLVSSAAALGAGGLIFHWVKREGGHTAAGLAAAGLFFATYRLSGRWLDLARVDSLALLLTLAALYGLRFWQGRRAALLVAFLGCAAFFTKQVALGMVLPVAAATVLLHRRFGILACCYLLALLGVGILLYDWATGGWFSFYAFTVPMGHDSDPRRYLSFWKEDVFLQQGFVFAACALALFHFWRHDRRQALFYTALFAAALLSTYGARLHRYGYINNLMPLHAAFALLAGLGSASMLRLKPVLACASGVLICAQLLVLLYDPWPLVPKKAAVEMGNKFLKELEQQEGEAFLPDIQFIPERAGKKTYSYGMGAYDVFRSRKVSAAVKAKLGKELETAIAQQKFGVIIPGRLIHYALPKLNTYYRVAKQVDYPEGYALESMNLRQVLLYTPRKNEPKMK